MKNQEKIQSVVEEVTAMILADMENDVMPWDQPWFSTMPSNASSLNYYNGMNIFILGYQRQNHNYKTGFWMTFLQAKKLGATVKKGEKGTEIIFFEAKSRMVKDSKSTDENDKKLLSFPFFSTHHVFNLDQIDGLDNFKKEIIRNPILDNEIAESILRDSQAEFILPAFNEKACFSPKTDKITLPSKDAFTSTEGYYSVAFHELTHWSGSSKRLNRNLSTSFGSNEYAAEELVAEFGAAILSAKVGMKYQTNHAAYIKGWLKQLKDDNKAIPNAIIKAQKAVNFILKNPEEKKEVA